MLADYNVGDRINHKLFGEGTIKEICEKKTLIDIDFNGTTKKMNLEVLTVGDLVEKVE